MLAATAILVLLTFTHWRLTSNPKQPLKSLDAQLPSDAMNTGVSNASTSAITSSSPAENLPDSVKPTFLNASDGEIDQSRPTESRSLALNELDDPNDQSWNLGSGLRYRKKWAVIVGIDKYDGEDPALRDLLNAENDAREFRDLLFQEFGFDQATCRYFANDEATFKNLSTTFQTWPPKNEVSVDDAFVFFFAGHGLIEGFLTATDSHTSQMQRTCLSVEWIRDQIAKLPCKHKLIILDSCYSGALFQKDGTAEKSRSLRQR